MSIICSICQENLTDEPGSLQRDQEFIMIALQCGHIYHKVCAERWFRERESCPICKRQSRLSSALRIYPTCGSENSNADKKVRKPTATQSGSGPKPGPSRPWSRSRINPWKKKSENTTTDNDLITPLTRELSKTLADKESELRKTSESLKTLTTRYNKFLQEYKKELEAHEISKNKIANLQAQLQVQRRSNERVVKSLQEEKVAALMEISNLKARDLSLSHLEYLLDKLGKGEAALKEERAKEVKECNLSVGGSVSFNDEVLLEVGEDALAILNSNDDDGAQKNGGPNHHKLEQPRSTGLPYYQEWVAWKERNFVPASMEYSQLGDVDLKGIVRKCHNMADSGFHIMLGNNYFKAGLGHAVFQRKKVHWTDMNKTLLFQEKLSLKDFQEEIRIMRSAFKNYADEPKWTFLFFYQD